MMFKINYFGDNMVSVEEFPISTANDIPGFRTVETKGFKPSEAEVPVDK